MVAYGTEAFCALAAARTARLDTLATEQAISSAAKPTCSPRKALAMILSAQAMPQGLIGSNCAGCGPRHCSNMPNKRALAWAPSSAVTGG